MFGVLQVHLRLSTKACFIKTFKIYLVLNILKWKIDCRVKTRCTLDEKFKMYSVRVLPLRLQWVWLVERKIYKSREERIDVLLQLHKGTLLREELYN